MKIINYSSLKITIEELAKAGKTDMVGKLENILQNNEREKSDRHNLKHDKTSNYNVDLTSDEINEIKDMFFDLEIASLDENYEATSSSNLYVTLLNNWSSL